MKTISIIGAGSHTRSSINLLKQVFKKYDFNIFDNSFESNIEEYIHDIKLVDNINNISTNNVLFLSMGDNKQRMFYFNKFNKQVVKKNLFHKTSYCEQNIKLGMSNQIFANVYINSYVNIGDNNIINTSAIIEHEVQIGDHNHISIGAKLCGRVKIGNGCMIGSGAIIIDKVSLCDDVIIGAGAIVVKNITESGTYVGIPARRIK